LIAGLANSVFQGNVIISEKDFLKKYPSVNGHRLFLIDTDGTEANRAAGRLSWALADLGFDVTPTSKRLMAFNAVENTYLSIFLILGGFGVVLGTLGIGIVVFRSTMERRQELALMRAVGLSHRTLKTLMIKEHLFLLTMGALCGAAASFFAALPVWLAPGSQAPVLTIMVIFILVIGSGALWTILATRMVLSQNLISALQTE
jgi:ABC-type antimicrobial peptide transport system permease subunit